MKVIKAQRLRIFYADSFKLQKSNIINPYSLIKFENMHKEGLINQEFIPLQ